MRRALFKHIRWTFRVQLELAPRYSAKCKVCGAEPDSDLDDAPDAQAWTMRHAAQADGEGRHHTSFHMIQLIDATVTPHPSDMEKVGAGWALPVAE